jgi:farnesyl-diphosphate farnesyltransferase
MSEPSGEESLVTDRRWTFEAVESVSRTFALSIDLLEEPVASWVCTGYLLCRAADTVEDDPSIPPRRRAELLGTYDAMLDTSSAVGVETFLEEASAVRPPDGGDDWAVLVQTDRVIRVFESFDPVVQDAMRAVVREMAQGMSQFLRRHADNGGLRLETVEELEEYCWYVAGTVGELFTNLLACLGTETPETDPEDARSFALLLQLVNIAKDVRADRETEDNVYLPGEWLAAEGVDHAAVDDPDRAEAVARVVERVVAHAESHATGARRYLAALPEDESGLLEAAALPYLLALGTARELHGRSHDVVERAATVKLAREEVEALYGEMRRGVTQTELDRLAAAVREGPYHRSDVAVRTSD